MLLLAATSHRFLFRKALFLLVFVFHFFFCFVWFRSSLRRLAKTLISRLFSRGLKLSLFFASISVQNALSLVHWKSTGEKIGLPYECRTLGKGINFRCAKYKVKVFFYQVEVLTHKSFEFLSTFIALPSFNCPTIANAPPYN